MKSFFITLALSFLLVLFLVAAFAPVIAPYTAQKQFREDSYQGPASIHFRDESGNFSFLPSVSYSQGNLSGGLTPIRFGIRGESYQWMGFDLDLHLFGLQGSDQRIYLLGTDALGRDLFSRLVYAVRFSLAVGLCGIILTLIVGVFLGLVSGYFGGKCDLIVMRICDLFLSLPGLFLVLGLRAVLPLDLSLENTFWMMIIVFTLMGWGVITRVVRGQVLSLKERPYVLAAKVAGGSDLYIMMRHILPFTYDYLFVQTVVFIPLFVLGEITLSFLGVGVQEPNVSLGVLLNTASSYSVASQYPWVLWPVFIIAAMTFCFNLVADELRIRSKTAYRWL